MHSCLYNRLTEDKKGDLKDESIDTVLQYHQNMQENIAEEMIKMAQNLKHSSVVARNIIKEDNKVRSVLFSETLHRSAMGVKWGTEGTEKCNQTLSTRFCGACLLFSSA